MSKSERKRSQTPKSKLDARTRAVVDRARSNAGQPMIPKTTYKRKGKYGNDYSY